MRTKVLGALSIGFAFGTGVVLGIALPLWLIWRIFTSLHKTIELAETGTRVMATVTRIATYQVGPAIIDTSGVKNRGTFSRKIYRLSARWQHPQTRKVYTLRGNGKAASDSHHECFFRDGLALLLTLFAGFPVPLSQLRSLSQEKPYANG